MGDNLLTCPYDPLHQILPHRFAVHLTRCARQFPEIKLQICPFNSNHRIKEEEMKEHKLRCPNRVVFEKKMNPIDVGALPQDDIPMPRHSPDSDDENWDDDVGTQASFDAGNTRYAGFKK